ncbi:hypothetical protein Y032_0011g1543 [Ancylostoma ceylanicum]|uniref:Uncharacterized protein n=1 Tax=Ancylostoma ceylanicum TaxID=53326 RepID=A0A016VFM7_9BILA|nr:hypothetical protein Y032_0011g1543 [Ancylostoma ceylanicum]
MSGLVWTTRTTAFDSDDNMKPFKAWFLIKDQSFILEAVTVGLVASCLEPVVRSQFHQTLSMSPEEVVFVLAVESKVTGARPTHVSSCELHKEATSRY